MKFQYHNPVRLIFGSGKINEISSFVKNRRVLLLTSPTFEKNGLVRQILKSLDKDTKVISNVAPNPVFDDLEKMYQNLHQNKNPIEVIIALGGGSVLDSAKVLSVYNQTKQFAFVNDIIREKTEKKDYQLIPIIAIPTTAGTGSEVTPWATVWDNHEKKKYSLHLNEMWPECSLLDAELTLSLPKEITLSTGLDALSHALESIWNKNRNPLSTLYAVNAAKEILEILPQLAMNLNNLELREKMLLASTKAGLAFSNTKTAIAHAISYYLTSNYGISHGIACSFSLPDIIDSLPQEDQELQISIHKIFKENSSKTLRKFFQDLGVSTNPFDYDLTKSDLETIQNGLSNISRASNSLVDADKLFKKWIG